MEGILFELGLIVGIAVILALIGRGIKQPTIVAYLITGILVGPLFFNILKSSELVQIFSHLGIAFLLFIVGLSLDFRVFKEFGLVSVVAGIGQVVITTAVIFLLGVKLGFGSLPSFFFASALAISSTLVVMNILYEKKEIDTLHGKISIGILIIQDFIAVLILMILPIIGSLGTFVIAEQIIKGVLLTAGVFLFTFLIIPRVLSLAARNQEILLLFSIGWAFFIAMLFNFFGFSVEVGALIGGMSLASSRFSLEISSKVKSLRDFFVIIHLVFFGSLLAGPITQSMLINAGLFSLIILIGNPLIIMAFMRMFGYKKQTGFLSGIGIAQISEFSLIIVFVGFSIGMFSQEFLSMTILVALITIALSSYSLYYSRGLYKIFSPVLGIFDGKGRELSRIKHKDYNVILFGYNRIGLNLVKAFEKTKRKFLIVDYNPRVISDLLSKNVNCVYGDANDTELLKSLNINKKKIIVSTIPDLETNLTIKNHLNDRKVIFIPTAHSIKDALALYDNGADYVIMPHFLGGEYMAHLFIKDKFNKKLLDKEGQKQIKELEERLFVGHEHPRKDSHGE